MLQCCLQLCLHLCLDGSIGRSNCAQEGLARVVVVDAAAAEVAPPVLLNDGGVVVEVCLCVCVWVVWCGGVERSNPGVRVVAPCCQLHCFSSKTGAL